MFVTTFYSYKGGVGRTLALVNCASKLASQGKKVFILDFDLEAPGVDSFQLCGDGEPRRGIVEYISRFTSGGGVEDLSDYVCETPPAKADAGKIWFMPAGRKDEEYQVLLSRLDWKYFYKQMRGFLFVENLKAAIEKNYAPDYVFVDSRTGLTDVSGICTLQLPDLVVLLFNLNNQNVLGISRMYHNIRHNKVNREIKTLLVASPVPDVPGYSEIREKRFRYAQDALASDKIDLILPFDPLMAFEEKILGPEEQNISLSRSYDSLAEMIRRQNPSDILTMLEAAQVFVSKGDIEQADLQYREVIDNHPDEPKAFLEYAKFLRIREKKEAIQYLEKAQQLSPNDTQLLQQLVRTYLGFGQVKEAAGLLDSLLAVSSDAEELEELGELFEARGLVGPALKLFARAVDLEKHPGKGPRLNLGNAYMATENLELALQQYEWVLKIEPSSLAGVYNYGCALNLLHDPRAAEYFERAIEIFEQKPPSRSWASPNISQAMSNAYVALGKKKLAEGLLKSAVEDAVKAPPGRRIFSSMRYRYIPAKEFVEETRSLLRKLNQK